MNDDEYYDFWVTVGFLTIMAVMIGLGLVANHFLGRG